MRLVPRTSILPIVAICSVAVQASSAAAAIVPYTDQATFVADTGASQATTAYP